jgi:hypothetical protein
MIILEIQKCLSIFMSAFYSDPKKGIPISENSQFCFCADRLPISLAIIQ